MKKMVIIIIILATIFIGMLINRCSTVRAKDKITINEIEKIEEYIEKIYMWKELTTEALPEFDKIENANKKWEIEVLKKNIGEYEVTKEDIIKKGKELFGNEFEIQEEKVLEKSFDIDKETQKYIATNIELDNKADSFLLKDIKKGKNGYIVEIVEYLQDYCEPEKVKITNLNGEEIGKISESQTETEAKEIVKNNETRFNKKKLYIKEGEKLVIEKVEKCEEK